MKSTRLTFPDKSVGELVDGRFDEQHKIADACGIVVILSRPRLILRLNETAEKLDFLKTLPADALYGLHLGFLPIANADLENLRGLKSLRSVDLSSTRIDDKGILLVFHSFPHLRSIGIGGTRLTDFGLRDLPRSPRMRVFETGGRRTQIGDKGAHWISEKLPGLLRLDLSRTEITDEGVRGINDLALRSLNIGMNCVTDLGVAHLCGMKSLRNLSLHHIPISNASLYFLKRLDKLEFLDISGTGIQAEGLESISSLPKLSVLIANSLMLTERAVTILAGMRQLQVLALRTERSELTKELRTKLPNCQIISRR